MFLRSHIRWFVVALLFVLQVINYLDRQTLSVMAPVLREQMHFSPQQYSYVVTAFLAAYTFGFAASGRLIDRIGVKAGMTAAVMLWSVSGILHAFATDWRHLAACRFLLGLGESTGPVGGAKAIGEWTPQRERGLSMAIFSNGMVTGAILAPPFVAWMSLRFGWRSAFVLTGIAGLLWLVPWNRFYHVPEKHPALTAGERELILSAKPKTESNAGFSVVLRNPKTYAVVLARLLTDPVPYFFTFWLPEYLRTSRHFSLALIGMVAWIPYLAADVGGLSGGAVSDWLLRRKGLNDARFRLLLAAACLTPAAAIAVRTSSAVAAIACIGIVLAAHSCWTVNLQTWMTEKFPRDQVGTVLGLSGVGSGVGGMIATLITGEVVARFGYVPVFTTLAGVHLAGFAVLWLLNTSKTGERFDVAA